MNDSLPGALANEMVHVCDRIMPLYREIGPAGEPGLALMRAELDAAAKALAVGDAVAMLRALESLRGYCE